LYLTPRISAGPPDRKSISSQPPCQQIVRLREQYPGETSWRVVNPAELNDPATTAANFGFDSDAGCESSRFIYNGPYLKQSDAAAQDEIYSIRIEPIPQETHNTELVYTADFLEIVGQASVLVIDPEGHDALKYIAAAELLLANDDDNAQNFLSIGNMHKTQYLKLVRKRADPARARRLSLTSPTWTSCA